MNGNDGNNGFPDWPLMLVLTALALAALLVWVSGCTFHLHVMGRYNMGEQPETVLMETNDEEDQGIQNDRGISGSGSDSDTLLATPD